jgi:hypothetical protein
MQNFRRRRRIHLSRRIAYDEAPFGFPRSAVGYYHFAGSDRLLERFFLVDEA